MGILAFFGIVVLFLLSGSSKEKTVTALDTVYDNTDPGAPAPVVPVPDTMPSKHLGNYNPYLNKPNQGTGWQNLRSTAWSPKQSSVDNVATTGHSDRNVIKYDTEVTADGVIIM